MEVLFTKKIQKEAISKRLGTIISFDFVEVIKGHYIDKIPFDLTGFSVIFTSVRAVKSFFKNGFHIYNKIYVVGRKTEEELKNKEIEAFKVARNANELADFIIEHCYNESFLHFCGDLALDVLDEKLSSRNISYRREIVYRTELLFPIVKKRYNAIVFFSPSGVKSFVRNNHLEGKEIFAIGNTTANEIRKHTTQPIHISEENNLEDLLIKLQEVVLKNI